jgi:hypothetical protein
MGVLVNMKISKDFELSGIVKIVVNKNIVWNLCTATKPDGDNDFIWIMNAEDVVDDSKHTIPETHFKTTHAMGDYVRDMIYDPKYRKWVHWDTINFEEKTPKYIYNGVKLVPLPKEYHVSEKPVMGKMKLKLHNHRVKTQESEQSKQPEETFKKFADYFHISRTQTPISHDTVAMGSGGGCDNLYGCLKKHPRKISKIDIDWVT